MLNIAFGCRVSEIASVAEARGTVLEAIRCADAPEGILRDGPTILFVVVGNIPFLTADHPDLLPESAFPEHGQIVRVGDQTTSHDVTDLPLRIRTIVHGPDVVTDKRPAIAISTFLNRPEIDTTLVAKLRSLGIYAGGFDLPEADIPLLRLGWTVEPVLGATHMPLFGTADETDLIRPVASLAEWTEARHRADRGISVEFSTATGDFDFASTRRVPVQPEDVVTALERMRAEA